MTDQALRDKIARALAEWHGGPDAEPWVYDMHTKSADAVLAVLDLDKVRAEAFEAGVKSAVDAVNSAPPSNLKPYLRGAER